MFCVLLLLLGGGGGVKGWGGEREGRNQILRAEMLTSKRMRSRATAARLRGLEAMEARSSEKEEGVGEVREDELPFWLLLRWAT